MGENETEQNGKKENCDKKIPSRDRPSSSA